MGATTTPRRRRDDDDGAMEADSNWTTDDLSPAPWKGVADRGGPEYTRHQKLARACSGLTETKKTGRLSRNRETPRCISAL